MKKDCQRLRTEPSFIRAAHDSWISKHTQVLALGQSSFIPSAGLISVIDQPSFKVFSDVDDPDSDSLYLPSLITNSAFHSGNSYVPSTNALDKNTTASLYILLNVGRYASELRQDPQAR